MNFSLERVKYMPKDLHEGILYVSEEFGIAVHLCACGCGSKIRTPLGSTEWSLEVSNGKPTLRPSVGNWQLKCQSHYLIVRGDVKWAPKWNPAQIARGQKLEESRRAAYYSALERNRDGVLARIWRHVVTILSSLGSG